MVTGGPSQWVDIGLGPEELRINQVMNMGQTWSWEETGRDCWTGVIGNSVISLKSAPITTFARVHCGDLRDLDHYLNRTYSLHDLYDDWSAKMERIWEVAKWLPGCRILRQDPWETLISFLVSANNNIARIHSILGNLREEYGQKLCEARDRTFYAFPPLSKLRELDEKTFKQLGFGYRARYMVKLCAMLEQRGGEKYLLSLREHPREYVREVLVSFPGIGAKVADCVALYSLDQTDAVPVDVHVYRLTKQYFPGVVPSKSKSLSPKVYEAIGDAFRDSLGCKAGWAQVLLFCAELPAFQDMLPEELQSNSTQTLAITDVQPVTLDRYKDRHVQEADSNDSDNEKDEIRVIAHNGTPIGAKQTRVFVRPAERTSAGGSKAACTRSAEESDSEILVIAHNGTPIGAKQGRVFQRLSERKSARESKASHTRNVEERNSDLGGVEVVARNIFDPMGKKRDTLTRVAAASSKRTRSGASKGKEVSCDKGRHSGVNFSGRDAHTPRAPKGQKAGERPSSTPKRVARKSCEQNPSDHSEIFGRVKQAEDRVEVDIGAMTNAAHGPSSHLLGRDERTSTHEKVVQKSCNKKRTRSAKRTNADGSEESNVELASRTAKRVRQSC